MDQMNKPVCLRKEGIRGRYFPDRNPGGQVSTFIVFMDITNTKGRGNKAEINTIAFIHSLASNMRIRHSASREKK